MMEKSVFRRLTFIEKLIIYVLVALILVVFLGPFYIAVSRAFMTPDEARSFPFKWFPRQFNLNNFIEVSHRVPLLRFLFNSLLTTSVSTLTAIFTSSLAGFAFAKYRFRGNSFFFTLCIATAMIPFVVKIIPLFMMFRVLGWYDTYWALIVPGIVSPYGIFLMRQFMTTIPSELLESGRIDGASEFRIYRSIILPVAKPGLAALGILLFFASWNSYQLPLIMTASIKMRTVALAIGFLVNIYGVVTIHLQMAGTLMLMVVPIVIFIAIQRQLIGGIITSGIKG